MDAVTAKLLPVLRDLYASHVTGYYGRNNSLVREPLTDVVLHGHLEGRWRVGTYFDRGNGTVVLGVIDLDNEENPVGEKPYAKRAAEALKELGLSAEIYTSKGKGYHITVYFAEHVPSSAVRRVLQYAAIKADRPDAEIFPKQDHVDVFIPPAGSEESARVGNYINLPFHGVDLPNGRTALLDKENGLDPYPDQVAAAEGIKKNSLETLTAALATIGEQTPPTRSTALPVEEKFTEGQRNNKLFSVAGTMRNRGMSPEEILPALQAINANRCEPMLPDEELVKLAKGIERYKPTGDFTAEGSSVEVIYISGDLPKATEAAWKAIEQVNNPPFMFRYGSVPVRYGKDDNDRPSFQVLSLDRMRHEVARAAPWKSSTVNKKTGEAVERPVPPPLDVIKDMLATPPDRMPLPIVEGITEVPTFAADGTWCNRPGYNPQNRMFYAPPPGLGIPSIPLEPTEDEVREARELLFEPLTDFPFASKPDLAHAIALGLLPYIREIVGPLSPLHLFDAPIHGSGKTLAARAVLSPALGIIPFVTQADDDEYRKRLTAQIITGKTVFFVDNVTKELVSSTLANNITAPYLTDRILGKSVEVSVLNRMIWVATGNNVILSGELARRTIRVKIDPNTDQPWLRDGFKIPNLDEWILTNRPRLIMASLTLIQAWIADGMPQWNGQLLGSFEQWSRVVGGILQRAGIEGFLGNLEELYEAADVENTIWREFVSSWWEAHRNAKVGTKELFPIAEKVDGLDLGNGKTEKSQRTTLGKLLQSKRNTVVGGYKITPAGTKKRANIWMLVPTTPAKKPLPTAPQAPKKTPNPRPLFRRRRPPAGH